MEVVVIPPHDCLKRHHPKPRRHFNPTSSPNRSNRRRRNSNSPPPPGPVQAPTRTPSPTAQIRILKRGEDLPKPVTPGPSARPGPFMLDGFYAGSACVTSPPPSELPLPAFFTRRPCGLDDNQKIASDLRRVLKLC